MLVSSSKMTNTFAQRTFKNVLAQSATFAICFWKVKESMLVVMCITRDALSAPAASKDVFNSLIY